MIMRYRRSTGDLTLTSVRGLLGPRECPVPSRHGYQVPSWSWTFVVHSVHHVLCASGTVTGATQIDPNNDFVGANALPEGTQATRRAR